MTLQVGDTVRVVQPYKTLPSGAAGTVRTFSEAGVPIVDFIGRGRLPVPARAVTVIPLVTAPDDASEPTAMEHRADETAGHGAQRAGTCTVEGCDRLVYAKGLCRTCYQREMKRQKREQDQQIVANEAKAIAIARDRVIHAELERKVWAPAAEDETAVMAAPQPPEPDAPTAAEADDDALRAVADEMLTENLAAWKEAMPVPLTVHLDAAIASFRRALAAVAMDGSIKQMGFLVAMIDHAERCVRELPE